MWYPHVRKEDWWTSIVFRKVFAAGLITFNCKVGYRASTRSYLIGAAVDTILVTTSLVMRLLLPLIIPSSKRYESECWVCPICCAKYQFCSSALTLFWLMINSICLRLSVYIYPTSKIRYRHSLSKIAEIFPAQNVHLSECFAKKCKV